MFASLLLAVLACCLAWGYLYVVRRYRPLFQVAYNEKLNATVAANPVIVLFDASCVVCDSILGFCVDRDPQCRLVFAAITSPEGLALQSRFAIPDGTDSIIAIHAGAVVLHSTAALQTLMSLDSPIAYVAAALLVLIPPFARDLGYKLFARVRYALFGKVAELQGASCRRISASLRPHLLQTSVLSLTSSAPASTAASAAMSPLSLQNAQTLVKRAGGGTPAASPQLFASATPATGATGATPVTGPSPVTGATPANATPSLTPQWLASIAAAAAATATGAGTAATPSPLLAPLSPPAHNAQHTVNGLAGSNTVNAVDGATSSAVHGNRTLPGRSMTAVAVTLASS